MSKRLRTLGVVLALVGIGFLAVGIVVFGRVQAGYGSLQAFSEAQNVTLSYNEDGQLTDRGTTENAQAILALLTDEWGYPVNMADLDPADPLVNSATEYMFQMATIGYHTLTGTQTVVLAADVEYNGELFPAGTYEVPVDGRYWTGFDRSHPLEGPARAQAWSGTTHGLFAELGVGTVTHTALQMGLAIAAIFAGIGLLALLTGSGLIWAANSRRESTRALLASDPSGERAKDEAPVLAGV